MEYTDFKIKFENALAKNGISQLSENVTERFHVFAMHLLEVNKVTNLTAIRDIDGVISKHFVDSLLLSDHIPQGSRVLDLGCGPGFPSLPLAIARPDLKIVGLDSTSKKINFVNETARLLGLNNLEAVAGRAEDRQIMKKLGNFDAVTSRAVANPIVLCELSLSYLKIGGKMLAMKGAMLADETNALNKSRILSVMGGETASFKEWTLYTEDGEESRGVIFVTKKKAGDPKFPRAYATIIKKPL